MSYTAKKLPKGMIEISVDVPLEEISTDLERAAVHITEEKPIQGYRPGKAPYDIVKSRYGDMAIYEQALADIVRRTYVKAVLAEHLQTYGQPRINVTKLVPGNPISFTATVAVIPHVSTLADFRNLKVESKTPETEDRQVEEALKELQKMQTKEIRAAREVKSGDKVVVDIDLSRGGVALDGGQARGHGIYLDEDYYVPGVKDQVVGLKEGDKKSFTLKFPKEHYQKHLAGQDVDFALTVTEVYELRHPVLDDEFARSLGQESVAKLRETLKKNMEEDAAAKERQRAELELLEKLVEKSKFEELPEVLLNDEIERMMAELKEGLAGRGVEFADYLKNIGKTADQLKLEFSMQAAKRMKTAILIREIAERERIEVDDSELLREVEKLMNSSSGDPETQAKIRGEEYQGYLRTNLRNRKVIELLRRSIVTK